MNDNDFIERAKQARDLYELACEDYLKLFCEKHGYYYEKDAWVGSDVGGVASVGDYFIDMATIRTDIDCNIPENEFIEWYDYSLRASNLGITAPNYSSWVKGCPRTSEEKFQEIEGMKRQLAQLIEEEKQKQY